jgi:hypothetical protein
MADDDSATNRDGIPRGWVSAIDARLMLERGWYAHD